MSGPAGPRRPCLYCGAVTRSNTQVCVTHRALIAEDWRYCPLDYRGHTRLVARRRRRDAAA